MPERKRRGKGITENKEKLYGAKEEGGRLEGKQKKAKKEEELIMKLRRK